MIVLGIDPGYALMGWGVVEAQGARMRLLGYGWGETQAVCRCSTACGRCNWVCATS